MTRQHKASLYRAAAVAGLILAAYFCRKFAYVTADPVAEQLANFTRIFIYLGLFAAWGIRAFRRVMQTQARRYLVAVAVRCLNCICLHQGPFCAVRTIWFGSNPAGAFCRMNDVFHVLCRRRNRSTADTA